MSRVLRALDGYWFGPQSAVDLGCSRFLFVGCVFLFFVGQDFSAWAGVPDVFWVPHGYFVWFDDPVASESTLTWLQRIWKVSLLLGAVGLWTRPSLAVAAGLGLYLPAIGNSFGKIGHGEAIVVLILIVLAASRCGDAISLDARLRRGAAPAPSGHYRWPVRSVWMLISLMLFSAGYSKLYNSGLEWLDPENLGTMMIVHQYFYGGRAWTSWGPTLAQLPWLTGTLAFGTIVLETGMPLAMLHARLRALWVPGALLMLLAFPALLGPFFGLLIAAFVFWVPWDALLLRLRGSAQP